MSKKIVFIRTCLAGSGNIYVTVLRGKQAENFLRDQTCHHMDGDILGHWEVPENLNNPDAGVTLELNKHDQLEAILGLDALSDCPDTSDLLGIIFEAGVQLGIKSQN